MYARGCQCEVQLEREISLARFSQVFLFFWSFEYEQYSWGGAAPPAPPSLPWGAAAPQTPRVPPIPTPYKRGGGRWPPVKNTGRGALKRAPPCVFASLLWGGDGGDAGGLGGGGPPEQAGGVWGGSAPKMVKPTPPGLTSGDSPKNLFSGATRGH